tara:strand:- start:89 stop:658 length:570 start_codon:yes stop_codon:yes gene_type:complete
MKTKGKTAAKAYAKKPGPCGGPNQPSCKEELKRMAKKQGFNESYQNSMSVSNVGNMNQPARLKGGSWMSPSHVNNAAFSETKKRIKSVTSDSGYKAFTKNPNAKGVIRSVKRFMDGSNNPNQAVKYQLPNKKEASSLIDIGKKYTKSKNIMEDISFVDKAKAVYHGTRLVAKYPNILSFGKSRMSKKRK